MRQRSARITCPWRFMEFHRQELIALLCSKRCSFEDALDIVSSVGVRFAQCAHEVHQNAWFQYVVRSCLHGFIDNIRRQRHEVSLNAPPGRVAALIAPKRRQVADSWSTLLENVQDPNAARLIDEVEIEDVLRRVQGHDEDKALVRLIGSGASAEEAAKTARITVPALKSRLHRFRKMMNQGTKK